MKRLLILFFIFFTIFAVSCKDDCKCDDCGNDDTDTIAAGDEDVSDSQVIEDKDTEVADENDDMVKDEDQEEDDTATDDEADDADVDENKCKVITLGELWVDSYTDGADYTGEPGNQLGNTTLPDWIQMMFYDYSEEESEDIFDFTVGVHDLGTEKNQSLDTCTECIIIFEDIDEESEDEMGGPKKTYFQESGSIEITEIKEGTSQAKGVINAKLVQVYLDMFSMNVIKVEGGDCLEFVDEAFDTFCTPECTDKVCGSDSCYGECGACDAGFECNETGTSCDPIPVDDDVMPDTDTDA